MKKKTIVFGSLLAVFLMLMIPNVSAVELQSVKSNVEERISESIQGNLDVISNDLKFSFVKKFFSNSVVYYVLILILYLISLPLSVVAGLFVRTLDTDLPRLDSLLGIFVPVFIPWLVLMLTQHLAKTEFQWYISFILYALVCFLSNFLIGRLEKDTLNDLDILIPTSA